MHGPATRSFCGADDLSDPGLVSEAILVWTGWCETSWPVRDEQRLVARFGEKIAENLLPVVRELERQFYESDAHLRAADLSAMGALAARRFRMLHPELSEDAVDALAWCYTFDNR